MKNEIPGRSGSPEASGKKILIVGNPNVGKSVLFNALTGQYSAVSNYPGTSVEVSRGTLSVDGRSYEVIDTPGMYSLFPVTEEERVSRKILMVEKADVVIHVIDAKNLERMLPFTLQLLEAGLPLILVLNIMDEARREGVTIDVEALSERLHIPVIGAVSTTGEGLDVLKKEISNTRGIAGLKNHIHYAESVENGLQAIIPLLPSTLPDHISRRIIALFLLADDDEITADVRALDRDKFKQIEELAVRCRAKVPDSVAYHIAVEQKQEAQQLAGQVMTMVDVAPGFTEKLSRLMMHPVAGLPILFAVLYFGLYKFVGGFGAGTVVNFLEETVFEKYVNPVVHSIIPHLIPWPVLQDLFVGEYGLLTLGLRYAFALILPIVTFFFIVFSLIEDTGYLPRLAMLIDRVFKKIGLSGRAVIPMVLGLGCATMATVVTRTLPTKRERVISTLLLALAVPCSAQLGVILALLEGRPKVMLIWTGVVSLVFLVVGFLGSRLISGTPASFYMEVPPLRLPQLSNILTKTYVRVIWYFKEILPLFLAASVIIWVAQLTRLFDFLLLLLARPVAMVGLPPDCAKVFLFGFFRRDYGAAGLYDLNKQHLLSGVQVAVACVALTLFLPCIAQFLINIKERGLRTGLVISAITLVVSFTVAFLLNMILVGLKVTL